MEIVHKLQQGDGTGTSDSKGTCTGTYIGIGIGAGAYGMDYFLTMNVLGKFRDWIYVLDNSEFKKVILRQFHMKPYLGHPGY